MKAQKIITVISLAAIFALGIWAMGQSPGWQVISSYHTGLLQRTAGQAHNVRLAARAMNGKIIPPRGEFSFNRIVSSWSGDRGYVKAPVSYDGELIPAWGGGVCQASSTLYNAALLSGLEITERHRHHFPARYVPPGQDAAVAQYNIDLRFRNPYNYPIKIEAKVEGDKLICRILSQKPLGKKISVEREIKQVTAPGEVVRGSLTSPDSHWRVTNHGAPGLRVAVYRRITTGNLSERTLISEDTYPPLNRLVEAER
jgi:vancomycin resistance protein YoaR